MPTTLPANFSALPLASRRKASISSDTPYELVLISAWSIAMLAISLFEIHLGLPIETFIVAF